MCMCAAMRARGVEPLIWPGNPLPLGEATHVLSSVSPKDGADPVLKEARDAIASADLEWVAYLSTTSVYGNHDGAWVDENTPLNPNLNRASDRIAAEQAWRDTGQPVHVFRLAGIYGPGRSPLKKVAKPDAKRVMKEGQVFSRIHTEDIAAVLHASIQNPVPGTYNLCDEEPAPPQDVLEFAADLLGIDAPPKVDFENAEMSKMARSFYADNKRVRNDLAKRTFGWTPIYPTYREGLRQIFDTES